MSVFDSFAPLDEIIQVIYQGVHRFVVLSNVNFGPIEPGWDVHVGLADTGRWWKGRWMEKDVEDIAGSTTSVTLLEAFAEKLAGTFINGELYVADWNPDDSVEMKMVFGTSAKRPLSMTLREMDAKDASIYTINTLFVIALAAQSRKCQLNPSSSSALPSYSAPVSGASHKNVCVPSPLVASSSTRGADKPREKTTSLTTKEAEDEIKALRAQLVDAQRGGKPGDEGDVSAVPQRAPKSINAAATAAKSTAPRKKARRFKEMQFDD